MFGELSCGVQFLCSLCFGYDFHFQPSAFKRDSNAPKSRCIHTRLLLFRESLPMLDGLKLPAVERMNRSPRWNGKTYVFYAAQPVTKESSALIFRRQQHF